MLQGGAHSVNQCQCRQHQTVSAYSMHCLNVVFYNEPNCTRHISFVSALTSFLHAVPCMYLTLISVSTEDLLTAILIVRMNSACYTNGCHV